MLHELTPETRKQLAALCHSLLDIHGLKPDAYDELYTHLEDKILAYLNGEEAVTEKDALILAREHFGQPEPLASQWQPVATAGVQAPLRKLLAVLALGTLIVLTAKQITLLIMLKAVLAWGTPTFVRYTMTLIDLSANLVALTLLWALVKRWQRPIMENRPSSPLYMPLPVRIALMAVLLAAAAVAVRWFQNSASEINALISQSSGWSSNTLRAVLNAFPATFPSLLLSIAMPLIWLWWSDNGSRGYKRLVWIAASYAIFQLFFFYTTDIITYGISFPLNVYWFNVGMTLASMVGYQIAYAAVALVVYIMLRTTRLAHRSQSEPPLDVAQDT